jgi:CDGSH-type Zn-finger protein/uncharacterized Fe-S cluster protein YjdI
MPLEIAEGKRVRILFDGSKCIHSRACVLSRPDVFVPNVKGEWIHPDAASTDQIEELAHRCPSGAIRYEPKDGSAPEQAPLVNTVHIRENGPLAFWAELEISGTATRFRATLCRCGASTSKPYCDGSHVTAHFTATGEPMIQPSEPLPLRGGALSVNPGENGPLHVKGPLEIVAGTGHTVQCVSEAWLCRCGHSSNKPFCDGSHAKQGFSAPAGAPADS